MQEFWFSFYLIIVSCRDAQEMKDSAYCFASKQIERIGRELPFSYTQEKLPKYMDQNTEDRIFYAETQVKTGTMNAYGQYLFAKLPKDGNQYKEMTVSDGSIIEGYQPYLFTFYLPLISSVCVPVDVNEEILAFSYCLFDKCEQLIQRFNNWRNG